MKIVNMFDYYLLCMNQLENKLPLCDAFYFLFIIKNEKPKMTNEKI